jgi:hypothetical protein
MMGVGKIMPASRGPLFIQLAGDQSHRGCESAGNHLHPQATADFIRNCRKPQKKTGDVTHRPLSSLQPRKRGLALHR